MNELIAAIILTVGIGIGYLLASGEKRLMRDRYRKTCAEFSRMVDRAEANARRQCSISELSADECAVLDEMCAPEITYLERIEDKTSQQRIQLQRLHRIKHKLKCEPPLMWHERPTIVGRIA